MRIDPELTDLSNTGARGTRRKVLAKRLTSAAFLVGAVLATLFLLPIWVYVVLVMGLVLLALFEFCSMAQSRGIFLHRWVCLGLGFLLLLLTYWDALISTGLVVVQSQLVDVWAPLLWKVYWPLAVGVLFVKQLNRKDTSEALSGVATSLFGLIYIVFLFSNIYYLRAVDLHQGASLVCYIILVTKLGDTGAYAMGTIFGKHPLMTHISPRKTIEGSIGAVVCSIVTAVIARSMLGGHSIFGVAPSVPAVIVLGLLVGIVGQIGDLAESLIKRDCQVKDTSTLMPGLGGVLDVLDSLLFSIPLFYIILTYGL